MSSLADGRASEPLNEDERAFLQRRIAAFGLVGTTCYGFFLVFRTGVALVTGQLAEFLDPSFWYHLLATLCFSGVWVTCKVRPWPGSALRTTETAGLLGGVTASGLMASHLPPLARPDYILLLALTLAMVARAIWVPSSPRRSLVLGVAVGAAIVATSYMAFLNERSVAIWVAGEPDVENPTAERLARLLAADAAAWWTLTVLLTTGASKVLYGLRREVQNARRLGQYHLEKKLGEGGMGVVYRARHAMLQRPTAVKLLLPGRAGAEELKRFEVEVRQTARLSHPNVVTIFDYGHTADGVFYYAMEYIDGVTLEQAVEGAGAMPVGRVLHALRGIAAALVEAHGVGLIHRDIKPANVLLFLPHTFGGVAEGVKLVDFGLVKDLERGSIELTNADAITGTPQYLSPEAILNPKQIDGRADLYAVGAVGYYLLTGRHVFEGSTIVELCSHHLHTPPVPPSEYSSAKIPPELERLVLDCLAKDPAERPQSARELERLLAACPCPDPWTADAADDWWTRQRAAAGLARARSDSDQDLALTIEARRGDAASV